MSPAAVRALLTGAESRRLARARLRAWWARWALPLVVVACAALATAATVDLVAHARRLAALEQELAG